MSIFSFISEIFAPAAKLIDAVHTSTEEKLKLKNQFEVIQNAIAAKHIEYETQLLQAQASVVNSEAQGASSLQRNWRPITMLVFLGLVVCDSFGWLANPLASEAWTLLQIGLGGYVTGRSAEKLMATHKKG